MNMIGMNACMLCGNLVTDDLSQFGRCKRCEERHMEKQDGETQQHLNEILPGMYLGDIAGAF